TSLMASSLLFRVAVPPDIIGVNVPVDGRVNPSRNHEPNDTRIRRVERRHRAAPGERNRTGRHRSTDARRRAAQPRQDPGSPGGVVAQAGPAAHIAPPPPRGGGGIGPVYRHFPTKEALFEAIFVTWVQRLVDEAKARLDADDAGAAFFTELESWLAHSVQHRA